MIAAVDGAGGEGANPIGGVSEEAAEDEDDEADDVDAGVARTGGVPREERELGVDGEAGMLLDDGWHC